MKLNIFKLIESEVFSVMPEKLQRFLIRLSLIDHLAADLVSLLARDDSLLTEMTKISSFIRHEVCLNVYLIHHLFLDYLRQRQDGLSEDEIRDTYLEAARWCDENDYKIDAISYYEKTGDYEAIIEIVYLLPLQIPMNTANFVLKIYDRGPQEKLERIARYHVQHARLLMSLGRLDEALAELRAKEEKYSALPSSPFNNRVLCGVYDTLGSTSHMSLAYTGRCDFDVYMKQANHYFQLSPYDVYGPVTSASLGPWASRVGTTRSGAMEEYIDALARAIPHIAGFRGGCMVGLDDLARGELFFYKGDLKMAENFIAQASRKAESKKQYEVVNRALFYVMRISVAQGNCERIQWALDTMEQQLEMSEYGPRYITYDIMWSWYCSLVGQPQRVANWLKAEFEESAFASYLADFGNLIRAKVYYWDKRYYDVLSFIQREGHKGLNGSILFGKLELKILEAACLDRIKDRGKAMTALAEAYELALSNDLTMPFVELGKDMRTLTAAAIPNKNHGIPREWLESINRKSATYAKRSAFVVSEYRKAHSPRNDVHLSSREMEVLNDLYRGLSRSEIAANRNLSLNTVKSVLGTVYTKLGAENNIDAIRVALERQLI
jgi:LuxR family maltose regulon positive regulatory protein